MAKSIFSSDKIHTLHHTLFKPSGNTKATLLIVHGMMEHGGRYTDFAEYLSSKGIAVLTYDILGHGRSIRNSDDLGYFTQEHPAQTLLKDTIIMANVLKRHYPKTPHFIMGHSMGSFIVRNVLQVHSHDFAGAILMGSSDYDPLLNAVRPLSKVLNKFQPKRHNAAFSNIMNKILNAKLTDKKMDSEYAWLCKNPEAIEAYIKDPLCGFDFTNNGFYTLFELMETGLSKNWASTIEHDFPMLFISGENDPVGNMGKGIRKVTSRLEKDGFENIDQILYPLMRHEPLHEKEYETVYADLSNWITTNS